MRKKKSKFRIVPGTHPKFGSCWLLKENDQTLGTFVSKQHAELRMTKLETDRLNDFLLVKTQNQTLKIDKSELVDE